MKTKEQICKDQTSTRPMPMKDIYEVMESFARSQSISFAEWVEKNFSYSYGTYEALDPNNPGYAHPSHEEYTLDQLYALFIEHKQTKG